MRFNPHIVAASAAALLLASCALGKKSDGSPKGEGGAKGGSDGAGGKGGSSGNPSRGGAGGSMLTSGRAGAGGAAGGSSPSGGAGGATWPSADAGVPIYDAGSVDAGGSVDSGASRADGPAGSARDAYVPCTVSITPESPPTLTNLVPGDTARLSVRGTIAWGSTSPVQPNWQWTVTGPDSTKLALSASQLNGPTTVVEFPLLTNGYYEISVSISSSCKGKTTAFAVKPQERIQPYWIRVLPPPSGGAGPAEHCDTGTSHWCPSQDAVPVEAALHLQAGQPASRNFDLLLGTSVVVDPSRTASDKMGLSVAVPAYIRIVSPGSTWRLDGYSNADHQGFSVRLDPSPWVSYSLLIVPQIDDISLSLAPLFVPPTAATALPYLGYQLSSGVTVSGHVRSSSGPGQDARILLRSEDQSTPGIILPSTIGVADSKGAYTLQASPGARYTAFVLAPSGSSLPDAEIPGAVDLSSVDPSQSNAQSGSLLSKLDFEWNSVATTSLIILTATADGTSPGAAVGVRIESDDTSLENAGTLTLPDGSTIPARGKVRREAITDNNGSVTFSDLPRAGYKLTLVPTSNDANAAITNATVDLTGTDSASVRTISLARKVKLSGALLPAAVSAGAKLVATDTGTDVVLSMLSATVASDGSYALMANPKRTYRFFVEPVPGGQLPLRMPVYGVTTTEKDQTLSDRTLSSGLKVTGVVSYQNIPVQGSVVQAFCQQDGLADCVPTNPGNLTSELPRPLAEVATSADGTFTFYLPDPGTGN